MRAQLEGVVADTRRLVGAVRMPRARYGFGNVVEPALPRGEMIDLPGRGRTFVRMVDGPADAIPVMLLHGWSWNADLNFAGVFEALGEHHPVIAPDIRLHGRGPRMAGDFHVQDATDDAIALLDALGIESALLCGFSMGGVLTADASLRYPDRVAGLVVQAAAACYTDTARERALWRSLLAMLPLAQRGGGPDLAARYLAGSLRGNAELMARWGWIRRELSRTTLLEMLTVAGEVARADLRPALHAPAVQPGEFLLTTEDRLCPPIAQRDLADRLGIPVVEIGTDHDLPIAQPDRYADLTVSAVLRVAETIRKVGVYEHTA
ncbi:alpha/beta fold hydrolase [Nocardia sp. NPDC056100]|uniref:alpha/beta fold hydrolase n=1 Tax=Nocardia sp. NPDC056100 TaxID=3345712 RepID=UPI0035D62970